MFGSATKSLVAALQAVKADIENQRIENGNTDQFVSRLLEHLTAKKK